MNMITRVGLLATVLAAVVAVMPGMAVAAPQSERAERAVFCQEPAGQIPAFFAHPSRPDLYVECDRQANAHIEECAKDLHFDPGRTACDFPHNSGWEPQPLRVQADPAQMSLTPAQVQGLNARATSDGLVWHGNVLFTTDTGDLLCEADTGADGVARCDSSPELVIPAETLLLGYNAEFSPTSVGVSPATGTGDVKLAS